MTKTIKISGRKRIQRSVDSGVIGANKLQDINLVCQNALLAVLAD